MKQVNLSVQGFYMIPDLTFTWATGRGRKYSYFSYGVGASEVEIDTLTGDFTVLRSDLVMDVGDSLNPAIDIGQVYIYVNSILSNRKRVNTNLCIYAIYYKDYI